MPGRNKDNTSMEVPKFLPPRMLKVAKAEGYKTMKAWMVAKVEEGEKKIKTTPPNSE